MRRFTFCRETALPEASHPLAFELGGLGVQATDRSESVNQPLALSAIVTKEASKDAMLIVLEVASGPPWRAGIWASAGSDPPHGSAGGGR